MPNNNNNNENKNVKPGNKPGTIDININTNNPNPKPEGSGDNGAEVKPDDKPGLTEAQIKEYETLKAEKAHKEATDKIDESLKTAGFKANSSHILRLNPKLKDLEGEKLVEAINKLAAAPDTKYLFAGGFGTGNIQNQKNPKPKKGEFDPEDLFVEGTTIRKQRSNTIIK